MAKRYSRSVYVLTLTAVFLLPFAVIADGIRIRVDRERWDFPAETNQQAYINYSEGTEKMILTIGIDNIEKRDSVWLFPVPAAADQVTIDIVTSVPDLRGENIGKRAIIMLDEARILTSATQIYTIPFALMLGGGLSGARSSAVDALKFSAQGNGVDIYGHIEKEGITSEIITAQNSSALYHYFRNKGLNISSGSIPVLDQYIGKNYSFVASWISAPDMIWTKNFIDRNLYDYLTHPDRYDKFTEFYNDLKRKYPTITELNDSYIAEGYLRSSEGKMIWGEIVTAVQKDPSLIRENSDFVKRYPEYRQNQENQRGVFVTFPTQEIYFPLIPTSVYGDQVVPATLRIMGHVTPRIPKDIEPHIKIGYFKDTNYMSYDNELKTFYLSELTPGPNISNLYKDDRGGIEYTRIEINAPSRLFTEDLWATNEIPLKTYLYNYINDYKILYTLLLLVMSSLIASILAGLIIFNEFRNTKGLIKLSTLGLFNCLTIFALIIKTSFMKIEEKSDGMEKILDTLRQKGYILRRRIALAILVIASPFLAFSVLIDLFMIPDLLYSIQYDRTIDIEAPLIFVILPLAIVLAILKLEKIKKEDKSLFDQLKANHYSLWTFHYHDNRKNSFIAIFSVLFLIITWLTTEMIKTVLGMA